MSSYNFGTIGTNGVGITLSPTETDNPARTPAGLLSTRAVETKDGWVGQIIVDKEIVWESPRYDEADDALGEANSRVVNRLKAFFGEDE